MTENAQAEGDDVPPEPLRVVLYGDNVATVDGALSMLASGASALQTIGQKLLRLGYSPDQVLDIHRGGKRQQRILLRDAAQEKIHND
jgi:hypothetical protein